MLKVTKSSTIIIYFKVKNNSMQGTCEVCGANNVDLQKKETADGQTQNVCNQCA